jgi:hypothetical protein
VEPVDGVERVEPQEQGEPVAGAQPGPSVFVVGSGRSGTSLLWRHLNLDPGVAIAPELHFLDRWIPNHWDGGGPEAMARLWTAFEHGPHFERLGLGAAAVARARSAPTPRVMYVALLDGHREAMGAVVGGDKTPSNFRYLERLLDWFPGCRIAFAVRDPRAVVSSLKGLSTEFRWARGTTADHVALWRDAARAALAWRDHPQVRVVRYEELVDEPAAVLADLHPFLTGRTFDAAWLDDVDAAERTLSSGALWSTSAISSQRVEAWRRDLRPAEAAVIFDRCRPEAEPFGYGPEGEPSVAEQVRFGAGAARRQAGRALRAAASPRRFARRLRHRR